MRCRFCMQMIERPVEKYKQLKPSDIVINSSLFLNVEPNKVLSKSRDRHLVACRMLIAKMLYDDPQLNMSLKVIGEVLGNRDHTTIIYNIRLAEKLMSVYPDICITYEELHQHIYGHTNFIK